MSSLVLIFCDTKKHKKIKYIYICLKKLIIMPWLGSFFSSTTQQPTKEKNYNKKKKKLFHKFWSPLQFSQFWSPLLFLGGWAPSPSPPHGGFVWCTKILQFLNFSRWRWLLLRIHHIGASFEQVFFFPQLTSMETNFNEKKTKPLSKEKKKKNFAGHVWALEMKTLWTIRMW